jgi:hypothetical protein
VGKEDNLNGAEGEIYYNWPCHIHISLFVSFCADIQFKTEFGAREG